MTDAGIFACSKASVVTSSISTSLPMDLSVYNHSLALAQVEPLGPTMAMVIGRNAVDPVTGETYLYSPTVSVSFKHGNELFT